MVEMDYKLLMCTHWAGKTVNKCRQEERVEKSREVEGDSLRQCDLGLRHFLKWQSMFFHNLQDSLAHVIAKCFISSQGRNKSNCLLTQVSLLEQCLSLRWSISDVLWLCIGCDDRNQALDLSSSLQRCPPLTWLDLTVWVMTSKSSSCFELLCIKSCLLCLNSQTSESILGKRDECR